MKYLLARSATEYRKEEEPKVYSAKKQKNEPWSSTKRVGDQIHCQDLQLCRPSLRDFASQEKIKNKSYVTNSWCSVHFSWKIFYWGNPSRTLVSARSRYGLFSIVGSFERLLEVTSQGRCFKSKHFVSQSCFKQEIPVWSELSLHLISSQQEVITSVLIVCMVCLR